jgi:hypothetical protein
MAEFAAGETIKSCGNGGGRLVRREPSVNVSMADAVGPVLVAVDPKLDGEIFHASTRRNQLDSMLIQGRKPSAPMEHV